MPSNIVIIGASGGAMVARDLLKKLPSDHSIILIDSQEVAFHRISSLRSAVLPGHETKSVADLQDFFPKGSNHKVVIAKVQGIEQGSVTLDREVDGSNKVEYKYLVVATGSKYAFPASAQGTSKEEILSAFRDTQEQVKSAEHILIVGGGPVGVEFAGEVKEVYGSKKVTLLSATDYLINSEFTSLSSKLLKELKSKGVDVHLSSRLDISDLSPGALSAPRDFTLPNGETLKKVDFILLATGSKPNVSLIKEADPEAIIVKDGVEIANVDSSLRLTSTKFSNVFTMGDAMGGKTTMNVIQQAPVLAGNIGLLVKNDQAKLKSWSPMEGIIVVPIGSKGGAAHLPPSKWIGAFGGWFVSMVKGKDLFTSKWHQTYTA